MVFLFQSQMEELEGKHTLEVTKLQKQVDDLDNQIIRLQMSAAASNSRSRSVAFLSDVRCQLLDVRFQMSGVRVTCLGVSRDVRCLGATFHMYKR